MKVRVRDTELFFDVDGAKIVPEGPWARERPTVLLLHTGPGPDHSHYKDHVGPALAETAQVVYLDPRGAGRSDWSTPELWTLDTGSRTCGRSATCSSSSGPSCSGRRSEARSGSCLPPATRARSSVSCSSARSRATCTHVRSQSSTGWAARRRGRSPPRYFTDPTPAHFAEFLRVCGPLYTRRSVSPDVVARMELNPELTAAWDRQGANEFDLRAEAARVTCPVLLLAGEDDPSMTMAGAEELAQALPAGLVRFERYAEAGHGVFRDRPDAMELVREFVLTPAE